ncbi:rho-related GTP-binding protein RhoF isoform X2 [Diceros bicornis minor]|uniref:rho-related GTP-binding protein RhoF isoform X2 n=1 Tax=Diceros bicornis minor TaxID=77932 RepID=UPI0026EE595E|nr:rho-related GTP-binding protein RhoF isoform X2 [Diceros bicornis minor]
MRTYARIMIHIIASKKPGTYFCTKQSRIEHCCVDLEFNELGLSPGSVTDSVTSGQEDYDRLRPLSYQNTHLVLICYDVMNPTSYDNVLIKWYPEVTHFCRGTPMVLIGCKTDLRKDKEQLRKLRAAQLEPITYTQGQSACEQIQAALYLECSAKFRENVEDVFREAAKVALSALKKAQRQKKQRICLLL